MNHLRSLFLSLLSYSFAALIIVFTIVMLTKILPYMSFERAINFLGTKPDSVLDRNYFMVAFYVHITSSFFAIGGGIFQFFPKILKAFPNVHILIGKIYVASILLLAAPSGLIISAFANGGLPAKIGFSLQCFVWWGTTYAAWRAILQRNWELHVTWMLRSYAVTLAAMSLRTESYALVYFFGTKPMETYLTVTWLSWVGNYFIAEVLIYFGMVRKMVENLKS
jgi:Predicted membrane protein (DUF2306)